MAFRNVSFLLFFAIVLASVSARRMHTPAAKWSDILSGPTKKFDKNLDNFDILTKLAVFAGLAETLTTKKRYTLFAPNDRAFVRLARAITPFSGNDEEKAFNALFSAVGTGIKVKGKTIKGKALVSAILLFHASPYRISSRFVLGHPALLRTLKGAYILSSGDGELVDKSPKTPNPTVVKADIKVQGRVIVHVIDFVLLPVPLGLTKSCV